MVRTREEVHAVAAPDPVQVVVGETGNDGLAGDFNDLGFRSGERPDVRVGSDGLDAAVADRHGFGHA